MGNDAVVETSLVEQESFEDDGSSSIRSTRWRHTHGIRLDDRVLLLLTKKFFELPFGLPCAASRNPEADASLPSDGESRKHLVKERHASDVWEEEVPRVLRVSRTIQFDADAGCIEITRTTIGRPDCIILHRWRV